MKMLHFNRDEEYIGRLFSIISMTHSEEINGENYIELSTLVPVNKKDRLVYRDENDIWHEFIVSSSIGSRDGILLVYDVYAEHSIYEIMGDFVEDEEIADGTAKDALIKALAPTRWTVGVVEPTEVEYMHMYHINSRSVLQDILELWGGELQCRIIVEGDAIVTRYVDILNERGRTLNRRFVYNKNMDNITKTVNDDDIITALYGYGKGDTVESGRKEYTKRLDFARINGGKTYVENTEARNIWGRNNGSGKTNVFGKVEFDDCEDMAELLELTQEELVELSKPNITYEASIFDMAMVDSRYHQIGVGDTIIVIDREFEPELRLSARVIKLDRDRVDKSQTSITLGNYIPNMTNVLAEQGRFISNMRNKQGVWDWAGSIPSINSRLEVLESKGENK